MMQYTRHRKGRVALIKIINENHKTCQCKVNIDMNAKLRNCVNMSLSKEKNYPKRMAVT